MTDFATDLWDEGKQPLPPVAPAESQAERLQRIAGNAALAREAEEAETAETRIPDAALRPRPSEIIRNQAAAEAAVLGLPEITKAAAECAVALVQVLANIEKDAGKAEMLALALRLEKAPPGIAEETARALARTVMRADPARRSAIALRIKTELGDRRDLLLSRRLADRLGGMLAMPTQAAPPPSTAP
jgi:hypothetical protein